MKVINWILFVLALVGVAFCCFSFYQYSSFSTQDYDAQIAYIQAEIESVKQDTVNLQTELEQKEEALRNDLALAGEQGAAVSEQLSARQEEKQQAEEQLEAARQELTHIENIYEDTVALREEYAGKIRQLEEMVLNGETDIKICYWSFDDGPTYYTQNILDFCAEKGIYVTFFTSREANLNTKRDDANIEMERDLIRKEAMAGHSVQNHTISHQFAQYGNVYGKGIDSFREQVELQDQWILENTGFKADIFRFPGGSAWAFMKLPRADMEAVLEDLGYVWIDWSCDIFDNVTNNPDIQNEVGNAYYEITDQSRKGVNISVMLSHDWNPNTVAAFKQVVPQLQELGYVFLPLFSQSWAIGHLTPQYS